ncbi:MAG: ATP-binding protein [Anaerolineae bacterium]
MLLLFLIKGLQPPPSLRPLYLLAIVQFAASGVYLYLWRIRDITFLGYLSFSLEIALISLLVFSLGPDGHAFVLAYLWPIIMGGLLIGRKAIAPLTLLSGIGCTATTLLDHSGYALTERILTPEGIPLARVLTIPYLAFIALLVWLLTREMERNAAGLRQKNEELRLLNGRLESLVFAGENMLGCLNLQQLLVAALEQLQGVAGATQAAIHVRDGMTLRVGRCVGLPDAFVEGYLEPRIMRQWVALAAPQSGPTAFLQEQLPYEENALLAGDKEPKPCSATYIGLKSTHGMQGVLTVVREGDEPLDAADSYVLQVLGHQLGAALESARLFEDLQHERNLLGGILANMGDGVFLVDDKGSILMANHAAVRLLKIREGEQVPGWLEPHIAALREQAGIGQTFLVERGDQILNMGIAELSGGAGIPPSTILVARDVTKETQVERMKSDFVGYVSHELRTPLTTIKMLLRLLSMDAAPGSTQQEYLSIINTQVGRQTRLVSNLLDFTRLEAGQYDLTLEAVDPRQVVQTCMSVARLLAEEKGVTLECTCDGIPGRIASNGGGLEQVLINLLSNAIKFTNAGGRVKLAGFQEENELILAVQDTGIGMTADQLGRIFQKFYTARHPKKDGEGTGLGLVISEMIVKELGGRIEVMSKPGVGSTFTVRLPLKEWHEPELEPVAEGADAAPQPQN